MTTPRHDPAHPTITIRPATCDGRVAAGPVSHERPLPRPTLQGRGTLEEAIAARRSHRVFGARPLSLAEVGQLCWAGQGVTDDIDGKRAAPSAGARYPVELFVVTAEGVDRYEPARHALVRHASGDLHSALQAAALDQESIPYAPACFVIAADVGRSAGRYGDRAERYCFMEAGHIAQNILLQATALHLTGVPVGAFEDNEVAAVLKLPPTLRVLYLVPIGAPAH